MLPQSRRRAKVHWRHILRIMLYALVVVPVVAYLCLLTGQVAFLQYRLLTANDVYPWFITFAIWPIALFIWWGTATSRYLKMRHPWGVSAAVVIIAFLAVMLINTLQVIWPYLGYGNAGVFG